MGDPLLRTGVVTTTDDMSVLRVRLETIRTNLVQVQSAKDFVAGRRADIEHLVEIFEQDKDFRANIRDAIKRRVKNALRAAETLRVEAGTQEEALTDVLTDLAAVEEKLDIIEAMADSTAKIASAMGKRWSSFSSDSEEFDTHIDGIFRSKADDLIEKIDSIDLQAPAEAWKAYRDDIRDQSDALFSEYVEFLGGLALRDTGLGGLLPEVVLEGEADNEEAEYNRDVCAMADELIRQIYYIGSNTLWHSMAVPGRAGPTVLTASRLVRLGFPDWTVWSVPLAAYQFGLVVVDQTHLVREYTGARRISDAELRVVFADAFATFTAGPAYALASVLTKLEPRPPVIQSGPGALTDAERVLTILSTLKFMDPDGIFPDIEEELRAQWDAAVAQSGVGEDESQETGDDAPDRVAEWSAYIHAFLETKARRAAFAPAEWRTAMQWPLLTEDASSDDALAKLPLEARSVRYLLNAAWYQRLAEDADPRGIAVGALKYWRAASKNLSGRTSPTFRGSRR